MLATGAEVPVPRDWKRKQWRNRVVDAFLVEEESTVFFYGTSAFDRTTPVWKPKYQQMVNGKNTAGSTAQELNVRDPHAGKASLNDALVKVYVYWHGDCGWLPTRFPTNSCEWLVLVVTGDWEVINATKY